MVGSAEHDVCIRFRPLPRLLGALLFSMLLICIGCTSSDAGTVKWIKPFRQIQACPRIGISPTQCVIVRAGAAGAPLQVKQIIRNATGDRTYIRISIGEIAGFIAADDSEVTPIDPAIEWDEVFGCAARGQPRIGMDKASVLSTCWGAPRAVTKLTTGYAVREYQFYDNGKALHLMNGVVYAIIERH